MHARGRHCGPGSSEISRLHSARSGAERTVGEACQNDAECQGRSWCDQTVVGEGLCRQAPPGRWAITVVGGELEEYAQMVAGGMMMRPPRQTLWSR